MNILFLLGTWSVGGVERVTRILSDGMAANGCGVTIVAHRIDNRQLFEGLHEKVKVVELPSRDRVAALRKTLVDERVDVVINQWALPARVTWMIRRAAKGLNVRIIEVQHNAPDNNNRMLKARCGLERWIWKLLAIINLRMVYRLCDRYVFLTPGVADTFFRFTGIANRRKAAVIPNPVVVENSDTPCDKENLILYVGRLSEAEKRPSRVLEVWRELAVKLRDWHLEIVGDGPDRTKLEAMASDLPRVKFMGFQNPTNYYQRAKLLLLTSEYEGFGMVLVEAMAHGCVPIVYGSCPAVCDVVENGIDGVVVAKPFNAKAMSVQVISIVKDDLARERLAKCGPEKAHSFSLPTILVKWNQILN